MVLPGSVEHSFLVSGIAEPGTGGGGDLVGSFPHLCGEEVSHMSTPKDFLDLFSTPCTIGFFPPVFWTTTKTAL